MDALTDASSLMADARSGIAITALLPEPAPRADSYIKPGCLPAGTGAIRFYHGEVAVVVARRRSVSNTVGVVMKIRKVRIQRFGGPEVIQLDTVESSLPDAAQVLLIVKAASINPVGSISGHGGSRARRLDG
jgi:hypothetical protein